MMLDFNSFASIRSSNKGSSIADCPSKIGRTEVNNEIMNAHDKELIDQLEKPNPTTGKESKVKEGFIQYCLSSTKILQNMN